MGAAPTIIFDAFDQVETSGSGQQRNILGYGTGSSRVTDVQTPPIEPVGEPFLHPHAVTTAS